MSVRENDAVKLIKSYGLLPIREPGFLLTLLDKEKLSAATFPKERSWWQTLISKFCHQKTSISISHSDKGESALAKDGDLIRVMDIRKNISYGYYSFGESSVPAFTVQVDSAFATYWENVLTAEKTNNDSLKINQVRAWYTGM